MDEKKFGGLSLDGFELCGAIGVAVGEIIVDAFEGADGGVEGGMGGPGSIDATVESTVWHLICDDEVYDGVEWFLGNLKMDGVV